MSGGGNDPTDECYVMQVLGSALGEVVFETITFVKDHDFEMDHGRGCLYTTENLEEAMLFTSRWNAHEFWLRKSEKYPIRPDGHPNRPMSAFTVSIMKKKEAKSGKGF
jgi:hypothetical protein